MISNFKKASIIVSFILIFISVFLTGCNIIEKLFINDLMPKRVVKKQSHTNKQTNTNLPKEIDNPETSIEREKSTGNINEKYKVILFFTNKDATDFVLEERSINKVSGLAKETILELIKGPKDNKKAATIPKGTVLLDIIIKEGICYVDFSNELQKNHWGGSTGEYMTVFSIVKTLTQFSSISKVQILIDGKVVSTLAGHFDISKPLENDHK